MFGSKFVELVPPADPSAAVLARRAGARGRPCDGRDQHGVPTTRRSCSSKVDPAKLNQTLGAIAKSFNGRGDKFGQTLVDLDSALAKLNPSLDTLNHELAVAPTVFNAYADASPDLLKTVENATRISDTIVDQQDNLDRLLVSAIGLADVGTEVLSANRQPLTDLLHLLVPTTDLTNQYNAAFTCGIGSVGSAGDGPGLTAARAHSCCNRSSWAANGTGIRATCPRSPRRAARSARTCRRCRSRPHPRSWSSDIGANQAQYGNQGILLNSDGLKQALFGPLDGPPRNTAQIGQPG